MKLVRDSPAARTVLDAVLDPGTFRSWDTVVESNGNIGPAYRDALTAAQAKSGVDEAVVTGEGTIAGHRVAIVVSEFAFLAGSIGVATAERLVLAVERATREGLPLIAAPASGGTRMQEGTVAFVQMIKIAIAVADHKAAGLPYVVYLRHPTTGGVLASWASQGHITFAEPGALIGFLGPRVYKAIHSRDFPSGVQVAENLYAHGLVDGVVPLHDLAGVLGRVLSLVAQPGRREKPETGSPATVSTSGEAWESITRSRLADRPSVRDVFAACSDVVPLHGVTADGSDPGLVVALVRLRSTVCICIGHDRNRQSPAHSVGPDDLRSARRGIRLAQELRLPVVTVIDTPGATLSAEAEEGGLAAEISKCLTDLVMSPSPTVALLLGQGAGGAALALLPADRIVACQHGWLSALPPEGASALIHRTTERAPEVAAEQRVDSQDLFDDGIVDRIIAEDGTDLSQQVVSTLEEELALLNSFPTDHRIQLRRNRFRAVGIQHAGS